MTSISIEIRRVRNEARKEINTLYPMCKNIKINLDSLTMPSYCDAIENNIDRKIRFRLLIIS